MTSTHSEFDGRTDAIRVESAEVDTTELCTRAEVRHNARRRSI